MSGAADDDSGVVETILNVDGLQRMIAAYVKCDDRIKEVSRKLAPIRKVNRERKDAIMEFMCKTKVEECYINGRRERIKVHTKQKPLKLDNDGRKALIARVIASNGGSEDQASAVFTALFETPETTEVPVFSRVQSELGRVVRPTEDLESLTAARQENARAAEDIIADKVSRNLAYEFW